jgi:heterodisulfide reductase subunit A
MVSALDLADVGLKVVIIDQQQAHGGILTLLDRQFPTDSCGLCQILPPDPDASWGCLKSLLLHPNMEFLPQTTVSEVAGKPGAFVITLQEGARFVDPTKCTRCGLCIEACPEEVPDPVEAGVFMRKALGYRSMLCTQSLIAIDQGYCTRCGLCKEVCPVDAIDLDAVGAMRSLSVKAVVVATGFSIMEGAERPEYGYGRLPDVVTTMELERMLSKAPHEGAAALKRPSDGRTPRRVAWIQCVGSRDDGHPWCSSVCCMISLKQARMCREILPEAHLEIFYMDLRACGRSYEQYLNETRASGVAMTRGRPTEVIPKGGELLVQVEDDKASWREEPFDLVVLSVGMEPSPDSRSLYRLLGLETDDHGFVQRGQASLAQTNKEGVYVAGSPLEPMDIAESVLAAHEAAALLASRIRPQPMDIGSRSTSRLEPTKEEIRPLVILCDCASTLSPAFNWEEIQERLQKEADVSAVVRRSHLCWPKEAEEIPELIREKDANAVIIGACTPRWLEPSLSGYLREAGLDADFVQFCNIREQMAWVHRGDPKGATDAATGSICGALSRIRANRPWVSPGPRPPSERILVIGGGPAGLSAAITASDLGFGVTVVEQSGELGGNLRFLHYGADNRFSPQKVLKELVESVSGRETIEVLTSSTVTSIIGPPGDFRVRIKCQGEAPTTGRFGAIIVATGASAHLPGGFNYGRHPSVMTQRDLEEAVASGRLDASSLRQVAMIQCVESRGEILPYCSRICCAAALKNSLKLIELNPSVKILIFYRDMRSLGTMEATYRTAREAGVIFIPYEPEEPPAVRGDGPGLMVEAMEPMLNRRLRLKADLVVLSTGVVPKGEVPLEGRPLVDAHGFLIQANPKFRPLDVSEGLFGCGLAMGPAFLYESMAQGRGAAMRASSYILRLKRGVHESCARVNPRICTACGVCVEVCPYEAREIQQEEGHAIVRGELCQACGSCVAACPNAACEMPRGAQRKGVLYEIEELLGPVPR